jgi:surface antigen
LSTEVLDKAQPHYIEWRKRVTHALRHKRNVRYMAVGINLALLGAVLFVVIGNSQSQALDQATLTSSSVAAASTNPLDQLSSADIAVSIADMASLPEATAVKNQAESVNAELAVAPAENVVVAKPQVVATALKSREDISYYTTLSGDTVSTVAAKFNITSNSLMWSNNLSTPSLNAGTKLVIPPVNGIVYTVKAGDTPQSLATKYNANVAQIIAYNDAEISGLQPGELIIIPNGQIQPAAAPNYGDVTASDFSPAYGSNGYDYGFCTWYVATQVSVPNNWGNASSWAYYAALSGWTVSSTPMVGAIAQTPYAAGGEGHVAFVTAVSADGSQIQYKDMNGLAGWGKVGYSGWVSASTFPHYIYH